MNQGVMIWLILVAFCSSRVLALSKCYCCKAAPRGFKSSKVLDMDFLMDFHYPKAMEQPQETAVRAYPLSEHFEHWVTSFLSNRSADSPNVLDQCRTNNSERKIELPNTKDQSPFGKFIRTHAEEMKRDFLTMLNFRKTRQIHANQAWTQSGRGRYPQVRQLLAQKSHNLAKRFFISRKLHHFPKARRFKVDPYGKYSWTPRRSNGHLVNVTKRDTSNRRMKLSDILARAGFRKDKEEAIKVVLPLLLSDLKDSPTKNTNPLSPINAELKDQVHSSVLSSSSGKQSPQLRNFKVKGDDGKEFSFSVSTSDVQQLMNILAKPNSSVVLERVSLDKNRTSLKMQADRTKPPGLKKTPNYHKAKDLANLENVNNTEALRLKEYETSVFESIVQLDIPSKQSKCTSSSPETKEVETTTNGDTTGS